MDGVLLTRVDERCVQRLYGGSQSGGRGCRRGGRRLGATAALPMAALHRGRCQRWGATAAVSRGAPPRAMRGRRRRWTRRTRGAVGRSVRGACHLARLGLAPLCVPPPRWSAPPPAPWQQPSRTAVGSGDPRPTDGTCAASAVLDAAPDDQTTGACSKPPRAHGGPCEDGSGWSRPAPPGAVRSPMGPSAPPWGRRALHPHHRHSQPTRKPVGGGQRPSRPPWHRRRSLCESHALHSPGPPHRLAYGPGARWCTRSRDGGRVSSTRPAHGAAPQASTILGTPSRLHVAQT